MMSSAIIIDDHPAIRMAVGSLLSQDPQFDEIYEASCGDEALEIAKENVIDLFLIDISLPHYDGFVFLKKLRNMKVSGKILFLSAKNETVYAYRAMKLGADGFISKDKDISDILFAAKNVLRGYSFFSHDVINMVSKGFDPDKPIESAMRLSTREIEVLKHLVSGLSNKQIAENMTISNKTVSTYKIRIMEKLNVTSLMELANYAHNHNLV
nr:response regulator transcription factor [uncultured Enterobacter sp.]